MRSPPGPRTRASITTRCSRRRTSTGDRFVDTSAVYAFLDRDDADHATVTDALSAAARTEELVTHSYVVVETTALLQRRRGLLAVRRFHQDVLGIVSVVFVDQIVHEAAVSALLAAGRRGVSFVDWVSFEVMRRAGIDAALATDPHFADQGFTVRP